MKVKSTTNRRISDQTLISDTTFPLPENCFELASVKATNKTADYLKTSHEQLEKKNVIQTPGYDMQMTGIVFERGS